jgi:lysyl-tRNA synthetase class 2
MRRPDFRPALSLEILRLRAELLQRTRAFFAERGFLEVETPLLSHDTVIDRHLDPLPVIVFKDASEPEQGDRLWLQTSPEFGMKRLLAAGAPSIYQITRAFRGGERGAHHNPEFTMVEWYGVGHDYAAGMQFLSDLAERLLGRGPAARLTFRAAIQQYAQIDPLSATIEELQEAVRRQAPTFSQSGASTWDDRGALLDVLLTALVERNLGWEQPVVLHDYPPWQSALARIRDDDEMGVAERFELYVNGIELANGYHELLDPQVLQQRNRVNNQLRQDDGKFALPEESRLLAAMEHGLPACAGCALGFDRLAMVAAGAPSLREVMAFPFDRA